jgi:hypothetical protein
MTHSSIFKLRVHIVPVGFEIDRVIEPLIRFKADKVWLIIEENIEKGEANYHYQEIKRRLKDNNIDFDERRCQFRALFELLNEYRIIIEKESEHEIFINVSTGNKIEAIAGMMAAMMFHSDKVSITPYYAIPKKYEIKPKEGEQFTSGYKDIIQLPNYKIERPKEYLITALQIIKENGVMSKKHLIEIFLDKQLIVIEKENHSESAKHSQLNKKFLEPLNERKFIKIEGKGRAARIKITSEGQNILKFLPK